MRCVLPFSKAHLSAALAEAPIAEAVVMYLDLMREIAYPEISAFFEFMNQRMRRMIDTARA